jgi:hypothetical protein
VYEGYELGKYTSFSSCCRRVAPSFALCQLAGCMKGARRVRIPHILAGCRWVAPYCALCLSAGYMKGINRVNIAHILASVGGLLPIVLSVNQQGV